MQGLFRPRLNTGTLALPAGSTDRVTPDRPGRHVELGCTKGVKHKVTLHEAQRQEGNNYSCLGIYLPHFPFLGSWKLN